MRVLLLRRLRDSVNGNRPITHARLDTRAARALGIGIRARSTSGCDTDNPVELASGRVASAMEARMRRKRQRRAASRTELTAYADYSGVMFDACRPLGPLFVS